MYTNKLTKEIDISNWIGTANIDDSKANGQYSPDDFGNYKFIDQINLNITRGSSFNKSIYRISILNTIVADNDHNGGWTFYFDENFFSTTVQVGATMEFISITYSDNSYKIKTMINTGSGGANINTPSNSWYFVGQKTMYDNQFYFYNNNFLTPILKSSDLMADTNVTEFTINENLLDFNGINWMTFNN